MKKLLAIIFCIALMLCICSCKTQKTPKDEASLNWTPVTLGEIYSDFGGVNIIIKEATFTDKESILKTEWVNKTVYEVLYSESYAIERYQNGKWVSCNTLEDGPFFTAIGIALRPSSKQEKIYSFFDTFDVSVAGKYRIITNCFVYNDGENSKAQECKLLAEFTVNYITKSENVTGYCGNTQTTVHIGDDKYTFMAGASVTLTDLLRNLDYSDKVCNCSPEYIIDTEFGTGYGVNITEQYVKYKGQQAELTKAQADKIKEIIEWAQTLAPDDKE